MAYKLACLGITEQDFRLLGTEALQSGDFDIAKKVFPLILFPPFSSQFMNKIVFHQDKGRGLHRAGDEIREGAEARRGAFRDGAAGRGGGLPEEVPGRGEHLFEGGDGGQGRGAAHRAQEMGRGQAVRQKGRTVQGPRGCKEGRGSSAQQRVHRAAAKQAGGADRRIT